jgi:putative DNA primase/helicase
VVGRTLTIKLEWGPEAAEYAERRFAEREPDEGGDQAAFSTETAKSDDEPLFLSKGTPYDSAKEFVRRYCFKDGVLTVYYWHGEFWNWNERCYEKTSIEKLNASIWEFLDNARSGSTADSSRFKPRPADAEAVIKCLKAGLALDLDPPCWVGGKKAADVVVFNDGIVDIETGQLSKLTPRLWVHDALEFNYDPNARCPAWEKFLGEVFEGDPETAGCIEEQLGLGMTWDNRFQRAFLWIGPKGREGKGTLAHIQEKLVGSAYVSLNFNTWMKGEFSAQAMIGKKVGIFPDVRFREAKWYGQNLDPGGIDHVSKEMLLRIIGGDGHELARKWNAVPWKGVLPMKLTLISNQVPNLNDQILASKFIKIAFNVTFRDREDLTLESKLVKELPGIAVRCLNAYRRLCRRGKLTQPRSGLKLAKELAAKTNAWQGFFDDVCVFDRDGMLTFTDLWWRFQSWCDENDRPDLLRKVTEPQHLSRVLRKEVSVRPTTPRI